MALAYLLDENISHVVAEQLKLTRPDINVFSIHTWQNGDLKGKSDATLLRIAEEQRLTLVTYDRKTIPPILKQWGVTGEQHMGVIFIDERSIHSNDIGGLVRALASLWDIRNSDNWLNVLDYLMPG